MITNTGDQPGSLPLRDRPVAVLATASSASAPYQPQAKQAIEIRSAEQYANEVTAHSELSIGQSLYPGQNYSILGKYLQRPYQGTSSSLNVADTTERKGNFASLHDLNLASDDPNRIQNLDTIEELEATCEKKRKEPKPSLLLFLRGHPSPEWLATIGWKCNVDPEFLLRHMDFRSSPMETNYFTLPALPSSSSNIIRLRIPSVGHRQHDGASDQEEIERLRQNASSQMKQYNASLKRESYVKTGDSIVRSFAIHDQRHYSLEQDVSICVNDFGKGWLSIIWLDNGTDLTQGPSGPWLSSMLRSHSWKTSLNPTILHRPHIALKTYYMTARVGSQGHNPGKFPQSASQIHAHYGRFLDPIITVSDAFYALSEMFAFTASAESQFLNMVEQKIVSEMDRALDAEEVEKAKEEKHSSTLSNLLYNKKILDEHVRRLKENIASIKTRGGPKWQKASGQKQCEKVTMTADLLLNDFEYLLERAKTLSKSCDRGMDIAGNNAMVAESRRAIQQAKRVSKLTLLAFFYIPASFTTSMFGMNFEQFGQGHESIWVWFAVLVPTYAVSLVFLYFDVSRFFLRLYRSLVPPLE